MHQARALVFDMDGLLLDTERLYRQAIFETSAALGFAMTDALHQSLVGSPRDRADAILRSQLGDGFPLPAFNQGYKQRFEQLCAQAIPLRPGVKPLLQAMVALPLAVATSAPTAKAEEHLQRAGIRAHFQVVIGRDAVAQGKPSPDVYLLAALRLGVPPAQCLALEDSYNGVRAATAAGMPTVMVPDLLPATAEMRRLCVAVLGGLDELLAWMRG